MQKRILLILVVFVITGAIFYQPLSYASACSYSPSIENGMECEYIIDKFPAEDSDNPIIGIWENKSTGAMFIIQQTTLIHTFSYGGELRELHYSITNHDIENGHIDLYLEEIIQGDSNETIDKSRESYMSYIIDGDQLKLFIGPNPYPNADAGQTYQKVALSAETSAESQSEGSSNSVIGMWEKSSTGATLIFEESTFLHAFMYGGSLREFHYSITNYDFENGHIDLYLEKIIQGGSNEPIDKPREAYMSYIIDSDQLKMFVGPNPYPNADAGQTYKKVALSSEASVESPSEGSSNSVIGMWENLSTGTTLIFVEKTFVKIFQYDGEMRELYYSITDSDLENRHIDLNLINIMQGNRKEPVDKPQESYMSYIIEGDQLKMFIGPNPYPNVDVGLTYQKVNKSPEGAEGIVTLEDETNLTPEESANVGIHTYLMETKSTNCAFPLAKEPKVLIKKYSFISKGLISTSLNSNGEEGKSTEYKWFGDNSYEYHWSRDNGDQMITRTTFTSYGYVFEIYENEILCAEGVSTIVK